MQRGITRSNLSQELIDELDNIIMNGWDKLIGKPFDYISDDFIVNDNHTVDILVGMITNNPNTTPYIKKITTDYLKIV